MWSCYNLTKQVKEHDNVLVSMLQRTTTQVRSRHISQIVGLSPRAGICKCRHKSTCLILSTDGRVDDPSSVVADELCENAFWGGQKVHF